MSGKRPSVISYFPFIKLEDLNGKPHIQTGVQRIAVQFSRVVLSAATVLPCQVRITIADGKKNYSLQSAYRKT